MGESVSFRRSDAYPCSFYGCSEPGEWVETREFKPNGIHVGIAFYGWCSAHVPLATVPHPEPPNALDGELGASESVDNAPLREIPLGMVEIATLLEVKRTTPQTWRARGLLPKPDGYVSDTPFWWASIIMDWAIATNRLPVLASDDG